MLSICPFIAGNRTYYPPANIITGLTALAFLLFSHQLVAQDPQIKRVLVLHGAWDASPWEEQFNQALMQRLQTSKIEIETSYQFLGVSSGNADTAGRAYTDYFKYLANVNTISVIVAALPIASQFLNEFGDEVLLSTPRVLVAPGFDAGREQNLSRNILIVKNAHREALTETLRQILSLRPETRSIEVMAGISGADTYYVDVVREISAQAIPGIVINYHLGKTADYLADMSAELPPSSSILYLPHETLDTEVQGGASNVLPALIEYASVPIFSFFDTNMGRGIIGGHLTSATSYAESAADLILQLFDGTPLSEIRSGAAGTASTIYDWRQLRRWNISASLLPAGAEIRYRPLTLWDSNPIAVTAAVNLLAILLTIIIFLAIYLRRSKQSQIALAQSEKQYRESEQRYRLLAENSMDVIWVWDDAQKKFTYASPSIEQLTGYTPEEILGLPIGEMLTEDSVEKIERKIADHTTSDFLEIEHIRKDGSRVWCEISFQPINDNEGGPVRRVGVTRNISDRKRAESERKAIEDHLRQSQKFESLGTLAGGIAHDFNNMLTSINGFAELAAIQASGDKKANELLQKLLNVTDKAKGLVDHILTFSRQTAGEKDPIDLGNLVLGSLEMLEPIIPKSINLEVEIEPLDLRAIGDSIQLGQVIINLITNAYQALEGNYGTINVCVSKVEFSCPTAIQYGDVIPGTYAKLVVKDEGVGLEEQQLVRIFEPFYTSKEVGNGLGLAIVHGILLDHNGAIEVQSQPGVGTSFTVYLPLSIVKEEPKMVRDSSVKAIGIGKKILIVDDQPEVLDVLSKMIEHLGCDCIQESDPIHAVKIIDEMGDDLQLVITDYSMATMTGIELIRQCKDKHSDLRFVLSTGFGKNLSEEFAKDEGAFTILPKPYNMQDLQELIQRSV